jgi:hypothetical protein
MQVSCCPGLDKTCTGSGSFVACTCKNKDLTPTKTTRDCKVKTCDKVAKKCIETKQTISSDRGCPPSNCIADTECVGGAPTAGSFLCIKDGNCKTSLQKCCSGNGTSVPTSQCAGTGVLCGGTVPAPTAGSFLCIKDGNCKTLLQKCCSGNGTTVSKTQCASTGVLCGGTQVAPTSAVPTLPLYPTVDVQRGADDWCSAQHPGEKYCYGSGTYGDCICGEVGSPKCYDSAGTQISCSQVHVGGGGDGPQATPTVREPGNGGSGNGTGSCVEQCPHKLSGRILLSCTGGSQKIALCNATGLTQTCGGQCFVCPKSGSNWTVGATTQCPGLTPGLTIAPTAVPTSPVGSGGEAPILNYQVAFGGVNPNSAQCVVSWPMQFTVLATGESKVYTDVVAPTKNVKGDKLVFAGSLTLTGFTQTTGVAVFVTGPKHLQVKYGINNQVAPYNKAGGEITLSADTIYDFSGYPLIAGDVVGVGSDKQDGVVNGVDFVYVKSRSLSHETVESGGYLKGDLDGNCQVNSNDVNLLKISLQDKQGQLY